MSSIAILEAVEKGFDHLRTEIGDRLERLERVTRKIPSMDAKLEAMDAKLATAERNLATMDRKLDAISEQVNHTNEVLQRYYVNVEHPLELRVTSLEGRAAVLEKKK